MADLKIVYRFCATLQLRTPLAVLEMHGTTIAAPPPAVEPLWHGIWVATSGVTFRELGIDADELPPGDMASEIGPVPADGGDLLSLLKRIRTVVEADAEQHVKRARLRSLLRVLPWPELVHRLGGAESVLHRLLPP